PPQSMSVSLSVSSFPLKQDAGRPPSLVGPASASPGASDWASLPPSVGLGPSSSFESPMSSEHAMSAAPARSRARETRIARARTTKRECYDRSAMSREDAGTQLLAQDGGRLVVSTRRIVLEIIAGPDAPKELSFGG